MERSQAIAAVFEPVAPPTAFEETVGRLGRAIKTGLLPPGGRLPSERALAEQLAISRSTLRAAIRALVQSGFLLSRRGRGGGTFVVASPPLSGRPGRRSGPPLREVLDLRLAVEVGVVGLAAERATPDDLARLRGLVERMRGAESFEVYRRADMQFHIALAEATRAARLMAAMTEVQAEMTDLISLIPHPAEVLAQSNAQHGELVALLDRHDVEAASAQIRRHVGGTEHILAGLMPATGAARAGALVALGALHA